MEVNKNVVGAILFHFCDSYLTALMFAPRAVHQGVVFDTQCWKIIKVNYLFFVVRLFTPK